MAGKKTYHNDDSMDINELAALDEEISPELIEELQMKLSKEADKFTGGNMATKSETSLPADDASLFEEPEQTEISEENVTPQDSALDTPTDKSDVTESEMSNTETESSNSEQINSDSPSLEELANANAGKIKKEDVNLEENFDDNFIKKYKAKLKKQSKNTPPEQSEKQEINLIEKIEEAPVQVSEDSAANITEKTITKEQQEYNKSLDLLDGNVKYSKYVIYIDPENVDFIEGLTVKERKNLVNNMLKNQNDISITKQRFKMVQSVLVHIILMILTISISIPLIYYVINTCLEISIDNYRRSQTNFQVLYREKGKITNIKR